MTASWVDDVWLAVDTETTGVDPFSDRVVEVAVVRVHPDGTTEPVVHHIVNPGIEIPDIPAKIHGITTARAVEEGISPADAIAAVASAVFDHGFRPVVMFNAPFDWPILVSEAERYGIEFPITAPVLDPLLVDRMLEPKRRGSRKLVAVSQHYAVPFDEAEAHGAVADSIAAALAIRTAAIYGTAATHVDQARAHHHHHHHHHHGTTDV